ncbi:MAG: hypothetical protein OXB92_04270 [Acidimicrobiaceae bacterium]|nr:hypothetical protein [Acidimicrobiia bacterium]MCY4493058.1 hypothetical protein [Acidimicrobiaceae bacterium]
MKSYDNSNKVVEALGEKVIQALGAAIPRTRLDLDRYRRSLPDIVATSSPRGLANWFHDRVWHHVVSELHDRDNIVIVDKGPLREIVVDGTYRVRIKRHDKKGRVNTYPTQSALEFLSQTPEQMVLDGFAEVRLIAGYQWNSMTHEIGPAVLSLRDGLDNVLWLIELPEQADGASVESITGPRTPHRPRIEFQLDDDREAEADAK